MPRSPMSIRVLLIEDHPLALEGLVVALGCDPDIAVVGAASTGAEGLRLAANVLPDVIVLDLHLPDMDGAHLVTELKRSAPEARALIVSASEQTDDILQAIGAGAAGYLSKRAAPEELRQAVISVHGRGFVLGPLLAAHLLQAHSRRGDGPPTRSFLTAREHEIVRLVARGQTDKEIAATLHVSKRTVQNHLANVRQKTGLHRRAQLARWATNHVA
jgi:DNA-binding NarL/FixJ family response regulator